MHSMLIKRLVFGWYLNVVIQRSYCLLQIIVFGMLTKMAVWCSGSVLDSIRAGMGNHLQV